MLLALGRVNALSPVLYKHS